MNTILFGAYTLILIVLCIFIYALHKVERFAAEDVIVVSADGSQKMAMAPFKGLPKLANLFIDYPSQRQPLPFPFIQQSSLLPPPHWQQPSPLPTPQPRSQPRRLMRDQEEVYKQTYHTQPRQQKQKLQSNSKPQRKSTTTFAPAKPRTQPPARAVTKTTTTTTAAPLKSKPAAQAAPSNSSMEIKRTTPEFRAAMLDELNNARQCYNLQPLQLHDVLNTSAQAMADQIVQRSFNPNAASPHDDYDNKTPDDRAKAAGWKYDTWVGENISYNPNGLQPGQKQEDVNDWVLSDPRASVEGWLCSKGHRDALLDPHRTHVGIAYASGTLPNIRSLAVTPLATIPNTPVAQYTVKNNNCKFQCKDAPNH